MSFSSSFRDLIDSRPEVRAGSPYSRASCPFHHEKNQTPSLLIYEDHAWCLSERRRYSLKSVYEAFVAGMGKEFSPRPHPELSATWAPLRVGSLAHEEITRRGILPVPKLVQSPDGRQIIFLNDQREIQVYRTEVGYRTVGRDLLWSPGPTPTKSSEQDTLVVYGMLDAALVGQLFPELFVCTPTWGQKSDRKLFEAVPGRLWVLPDRGEEETAIKLLSSLGWRSGGLITMPKQYKDPCEMSESRGVDAVRDFVLSSLGG